MIAHAWQILVVALPGWLNRQQQDVVEYLQEENRVLREHLKGKRRLNSGGRVEKAVGPLVWLRQCTRFRFRPCTLTDFVTTRLPRQMKSLLV